MARRPRRASAKRRSLRCPDCDAPRAATDRFCGTCGVPLSTSASQAKGVSAPAERSAGGPRHQSRWRGYIYRALAIALFIGAVAIWGDLRQSLRRSQSPNLALVAIGILAAGGGTWLFKRGKQHIAPTAEELMAADPRPPVVYLRSFRDDELSSTQHGGRGSFLAFSSEEEQVAHVLNDFGPFVAIGRPGDELPELGAARLYVPDTAWQRQVLDLMARARLVVFRAGATEGLWWELAQAARRLRPNQVLFLVPLGESEYDVFRARADQVLGHRLPPHPGHGKKAGSLQGVVYFGPRWRSEFVTFTPRFLRTSSLKPISSMLQRALRPVFEAHGLPWRDAGINWWLAYLTFIATAGVLTLLVIGVGLAMGWIDPT